MKYILFAAITALLLLGCSNDEKAAETVLTDVERGAFLRTLQINNSEFNIEDLSSRFSVQIQEQDLEDGDLLDRVDVYVRFLDNNMQNGNASSEEVLLETLSATDFAPGSFNLPVTTLNYDFERLLTATGVDHALLACKDQFIIHLVLTLTDGRTFSDSNSSACIIGFDTPFGSPFIYTINIVEQIDPDLFTGMYLYESILDGFFGPTFGPPFLVEVKNGNSHNEREVTFDNFPTRPPRMYRFTIACDELIFGKNQIRYNTLNASCLENGQPILLGPDTENAPVNPDDDSRFEIWFVEGYLGFDGDFGFGTVPSRIRLTKQ